MARENHMDSAFHEIWAWFKGIFNRHRIRHIEGFGYVAEVFHFPIGWCAIWSDGSSGCCGDSILAQPAVYACATEAEAGQRINRNDSSGKIVWKG